MKVYINTDIEGIAGWVFYATMSDSLFNYHHVQRMNMLLTNEVNAAAKACFDCGAGEKGVPLVTVSGDDKIAAEVHSKIPECETAIVKQSLVPQNSCSLIPARACGLIAEKVKTGLTNRKR